MDFALVSRGSSLAYGKPEPEAAPICTALFKWTEELFRFSGGQAAALVLDVEENGVGRCMDGQGNAAALASELECVLQEIRKHRGEQRAIAVDGQHAVNGIYGEVGTARARACINAPISTSSMNSATEMRSAVFNPAVSRTSASELSTRSRRPIRLLR